MGDTQALDIARLGAQGDGVADTPAGPVFVPYVLPGERVQADVRGERARLVAVLDPSPDRIAPVCRHFTHCGGCALQHWSAARYLAWKREMVVDGLRRAGHRGAGRARGRRSVSARAGARRSRRGARGAAWCSAFIEARGNEIVDLQECPVTASAIVRALPGLKRAHRAADVARRPCGSSVTLAANGLDVAHRGRARRSVARGARARGARGGCLETRARSRSRATRSTRHDPGGALRRRQRGAAGARVPAGGTRGGGRDGAPGDGGGRPAKRVVDLFCGSAPSPSRWRSDQPCSPSTATRRRSTRWQMRPSARRA